MTLASFLGGLVGLSAVVGVPDVSTLLAWVSGLAAVVLGIVALVRRQAPTFAAVAGIALPIVGHAVLLGAWVLLVVGVMSVAGLG